MYPLRLFAFEQVTKGKSSTYLFTRATAAGAAEGSYCTNDCKKCRKLNEGYFAAGTLTAKNVRVSKPV